MLNSTSSDFDLRVRSLEGYQIPKSRRRLSKDGSLSRWKFFPARRQSLRDRFSDNFRKLHELDKMRIEEYGWAGGFLVISDLRQKIKRISSAVATKGGGEIEEPACYNSFEEQEQVRSTD